MHSQTSIAGDIPADAQSEAVLLQLGELGPVGDHHQCTHRQAKRFARIIWVQKALFCFRYCVKYLEYATI
jgi:hypothetical protein